MKIKMLVMDVDGTLTDGRIYIGADGEVMKAFKGAVARHLPIRVREADGIAM